MRVLYMLRRYPQISETYIETELRELAPRHEIRIVSLGEPDHPAKVHHPFTRADASNRGALRRIIEEFRPDCLHSHYVQQAPMLSELAEDAHIRFTIRSHSYDVLGNDGYRVHHAREAINSRWCAGVLLFPFARRLMAQRGIREEKLIDCYPVVDFERFHDEAPNGDAVMNVGACLPKKDHASFIHLAGCLPEFTFNLYAMGYDVGSVAALNRELGCPVNLMPVVDHQRMPAEYKRHRWLVYTAQTRERTVGWPMAVAEAQAAGVGVAMQDLGPDLREYVGEAGYTFATIEEATAIITGPFPEERRRLGFELARRSDVREHIGSLERLWSRT